MRENEIRLAIQKKPRLTPVFKSALCIPERLEQYNDNLFICHNCVSNRFEIHSLDNPVDSFCGELPFRTLDARTLHWVWQNDIRVHGTDIFKRIDKSEEDVKRSKDREYRNWLESVASETQSMFAKDAWAMGT